MRFRVRNHAPNKKGRVIQTQAGISAGRWAGALEMGGVLLRV